MIEEAVIHAVRNGICAVGYLTVPPGVYREDMTRPFFKVVGTGFLVRDNTAITNRHVIEGLREAQSDFGFPDDQRGLGFVYLAADGLCKLGFCQVGGLGVANDDTD